MTTPISNPIKESSAVVTRLRKRRDLETTMNTLKQLLEPTLAIPSKTGSRKKSKPRSLAKKVVAPKKVNPFENFTEGEYYPNKMKRKVRLKKTVLKPRHELKMVMATNKRKRGTPHKGLESLYGETPACKLIEQSLEATNCVILNVHTECNLKEKTDYLKVDTDFKLHTPPASNPDKYELISPPHKSLTEMTVDDLIRMDEDSLSDENLMEILTCPSPVWWEDPEECRGSLFIIEGAETCTTNIANNTTHDTNTHSKAISKRRTETVGEIKNKGKKIAKLESILGHIKSLAQSDKTLVSNDPAKDNVPDASVVTDSIPKMKDNNEDEAKVKEMRTCDLNIPRRKISSSGSEISVNEDDLLRNLESIDIPIQGIPTQDKLKKDVALSDIKVDFKDNFIDVNDHEMIPIFDTRIKTCDDVKKGEEESSEVNESDEIDSDILDSTFNDPERYRKKYSNRNKESNNPIDSIKDNKSKNKNYFESINKKKLKRLQKQNDDILDVRLIKTPTNVTNEVQVWSKLDNFKRHNFKPQDFVSEVIDVEDELDFSMIDNSSLNEHDTPKSKSETILIDDDSNDETDVNTMLKVNDTINIDSIELCSDVTMANIIENDEVYQSCDQVDQSKEAVVGKVDKVKEDTVITDNNPYLRIVKTVGTLQEVSIKPKGKRKKTATLKQPRKRNIQNIKKKKMSVSGVKILPMATVDIAPPSLMSCPAEISYQYLDKHRSQRTIELKKKVEKSNTLDALDTADANDTILCLDDVDVSLVKNPVARKGVKLIKNKVKPNDLSTTLVEAIPITTNNSNAVFESALSVKSVTSNSSVEFYDGTISDMDIQFLDEYQDNKDEGEDFPKNCDRTSEERDIELRKDLIIVKHLAEDNDVTDPNIDIEFQGNDSRFADMEEGGETIKIKYLDEKDIESLVNAGKVVPINDQDNLEEIRDEPITLNEEIRMAEHSSEDALVATNKTKVNLLEDKVVGHENSDDVDGDPNKNTNSEEFVTIYQIVSNSQVENIEPKEIKCIEEG